MTFPTCQGHQPRAPNNPRSRLLLFLVAVVSFPSQMARHAIASSSSNFLFKNTLLFAFVALLTLYAVSNAFFSPISRSDLHQAFSSSSSSTSSSLLANLRRPPKIYLYDLPRKFTYGVIESYLLARDPSRSPVTSDADLKYPGHQHSAEWYLLKDLLRRDRDDSPVVRVEDPREADLFYVPFLSSLSLIVNPIRPPEGGGDAAAADAARVVYSDEDAQEELMEWLEGREWWTRNGGRDHVFVCQDPNALYKVVDRLKNAVLLVSDFGRLRGDRASLVKDVILPYSHRINPFKGEVGVEGRWTLLFFMGNRYRKEGGKIRDTLFQILEDEDDVIIKHGAQSRESRRMATQGMHSSIFCLHPAGDTPSACRLFDAIVSLCIPVIASDQIELPFENVIDYQKIAVFVDTENAVKQGYLTNLLRGISTDRILQYQKDLKDVRRFFEYEDPDGTVNAIWHQVASKVPLTKLMINRDKRLFQREAEGLDCSCMCSSYNGSVNFVP